MPFLPFPKKMQVKIFQTNESVQLGSFELAENIDLEHIRIMFIKNGAVSAGATMQMSLGANSTEASHYIESDVVSVDDITSAEYWVGWVRFDFGGKRILANSAKHVRVKLANYTEADEIYLAYAFDDTLLVNEFNSPENFAASMQIVGNK